MHALRMAASVIKRINGYSAMSPQALAVDIGVRVIEQTVASYRYKRRVSKATKELLAVVAGNALYNDYIRTGALNTLLLADDTTELSDAFERAVIEVLETRLARHKN